MNLKLNINFNIALVLLLLTAIHIPGPNGTADYYFIQYFIGSIILLGPIAYWIAKSTSILVGGLVYHIGVSAFANCFWQFNKFANAPGAFRNEMGLSGFQAAGLTLIVLSSLLLLKDKREEIKKHIGTITIINSLYVIIGWIFKFGRYGDGTGYSGFLDYSGMNGVLIASCLNFLPHPGFLIPSILAVFLSKSSIALGVMLVTLLSATVMYVKNLKHISIATTVALMVLGVTLYFDPYLFDSGHRFEAYKIFMGDWSKASTWVHVFGAGPGSFAVLGPIVGAAHKFMPEAGGTGRFWEWYWLHSDWLQSVYELGVSGFLLSLGIYGKVLHTLWKRQDSKMFSLACGLGSSAVFNYPLRYFLTAFLIAFCLVDALDRRHTNIS